jgi:hypothetical protein
MATLDSKFEELIQSKRVFLSASVKDYATGGNDMLDDIEAYLNEAKTELLNNIELASFIREESGETAYNQECLAMFNSWFDKWFGKP